jgi:NAD+ diphosphatase
MSRFVRAYPHVAATAVGDSYLFPFIGDDLLVRERAENLTLLHGPPPDEALYLGSLDGIPCVAFPTETPLEDDQIEGEVKAFGLRALHGRLSDDQWAVACYGAQLVRWHRCSRFCPACGERTVPDDGWSARCVACGFSRYPPVTPAVLCLVHDGADRILLATKEGWGMRYSILAGFTEPGESLEDTCFRECLEEAGVTVANPRYDGSQPWPFPHQLMVAFWAQADPDEPLVLDTDELKEARWFHVDELKETLLPGPISLSRQTIDRWVASRGR